MDMLSLVPLALSAAPLYLPSLYSTLLYCFLSRSLSLRPSLCLSVFRSLALALYLPSLSHSRSLLLHPPRSPMHPSFLRVYAAMYARVWLSLTGDMSSVLARVATAAVCVCVCVRVRADDTTRR